MTWLSYLEVGLGFSFGSDWLSGFCFCCPFICALQALEVAIPGSLPHFAPILGHSCRLYVSALPPPSLLQTVVFLHMKYTTS